MMYRVFICIVWISSGLLLRAVPTQLDSLTVGSVTYSNVTIISANATDLFFKSDEGFANVKLEFLSPELQKEFNYNPAAGLKAERQQIEDEKRYQSNLAASLSVQSSTSPDPQRQARYSAIGLGDSVSSNSPIGRIAPALDFTNWVGLKPDLTNKFAIISVWSPKSASCRKWIPQLNKLSKSLAGKLEVVGVTTATESEVSQSDPKIDFPCALDPKGKFLSAAGIDTIPCVLFVDTNYMVRYKGHPAALSAGVLDDLFTNTPGQ
jgi:thiol-disulfide isomerase/thioredoxin